MFNLMDIYSYTYMNIFLVIFIMMLNLLILAVIVIKSIELNKNLKAVNS